MTVPSQASLCLLSPPTLLLLSRVLFSTGLLQVLLRPSQARVLTVRLRQAQVLLQVILRIGVLQVQVLLQVHQVLIALRLAQNGCLARL